MRWSRLILPGIVLSVAAVASCDRFDHDGITGPPVRLSPDVANSMMAASTTPYLYTLDGDFDAGTLVSVNHDAPGSNQLQLNTASGTFPFIWVALSQRCTIAKVNTATGDILGEYRTVADGVFCRESSRTTVAIDGSVWVGHRGPGGVAHIGLVELNQCVDRNGNGTIETSSGYGDVKPWPGGSPSQVANAADECILHQVNTDALGFGDSRHMSIDASNKLWVGSFVGLRGFVRIDGTTGAIETAVKPTLCGGYGGLIDGNGVIWSANGGSAALLRWDPNAPDVAGQNPRCIPIPAYGLAIDQNGWVWVNEIGINVRKVSPDGNTILGPFLNGSQLSSGHSQGLAVDANGDVWLSSGLGCTLNCTIGHLKNDGTFVGNVPTPTGSGSTGISIDADGKIWSANRNSHTATRIDPTLGPIGGAGTTVGQVDLTVSFPSGPDGRPVPFPYNYSDMTGAQLFGSTAPQGSWTVTQDGGAVGTMWSSIAWNGEPEGTVPDGASITVEARAADTEAGLGAQAWVAVDNGVDFSLTGRFIQVRTTLRASADGDSPILSDLTIFAVNPDGEPPVVTNIEPSLVAVSTAFDLTAHVSDIGLGDSDIVAAHFQFDGGPLEPMSAADGTFDSPAEDVAAAIPDTRFTEAGVHTVCVHGEDGAGNIGVACALLVVYDPSGGFVTGGGWIDSPPNAYAPDPSVIGRANFGFVSRYRKGAIVPDGQTEFQFRAAGLNFHSSSYEWLVVAGARAQFKGSGMINGGGDYGFMLTAIDGQVNGGGGTDRLRLKIWDKSTGTILYDNQPGDGDDAAPSTAIGGGSIVIHNK